MEEGGREEGPEEVHDEGEGGGEIQREAVVFVRRDSRGGAGDGLRAAVGAG